MSVTTVTLQNASLHVLVTGNYGFCLNDWEQSVREEKCSMCGHNWQGEKGKTYTCKSPIGETYEMQTLLE